MGRIECDQTPRDAGAARLASCARCGATCCELGLQQRAQVLGKARALGQQPLVE